MLNRKLMPCVVACALLLFGSVAQAQLDFFYLETFNDMEIDSEINGQAGWSGYEGQSSIYEIGGLRMRGLLLESLSPAHGFTELAESPKWDTAPSGNGDDWVLNMTIAFNSRQNSWYVTPKNYSDNTVVTRLKFEEGGTLSIFQPDGFGGGDYVLIEDFTWQANTLYRVYIVVRPSGELFLLIDSRRDILFQGATFSTGIEGVAFESANDTSEQLMFIDMVTCGRGTINR